ncbi:RNA 2',3'-cyclic phosphodiesterase [Halobacteriales archaeon QS_3_64_16]|nr:MAG: RNA 2',3'-cyclic phosphodiesterase [Halobacteriales archaeon QS_3_64_16]
MRTFVSVDPEGLGGEIEALQGNFEDISGLDFVAPENVHLTLFFLGDIGEDRLGAITDAIEEGVSESGVSPFRAAFDGLGVFPSREYIRVLWVGVSEGSEELTRLQERIEGRFTDLGFEPDDHEFTPHATIARMRHAGGKERLQSKLDELDPTVGTRKIEEIHLTESTLTEEGPEYEAVERVPL